MEGMRDRSSRVLAGSGVDYVFYTLVVFTLVFSTRLDTRLIALVYSCFVFWSASYLWPTIITGAATAVLLVLRRVISPPLKIVPVDMTGKTVIVTGANSGCGKETARLLFLWGATVIMACRDTNKAERTANEIRRQARGQKKGAGSLVVEYLDLESFGSIRAFVRRLEAAGRGPAQRSLAVNVLVNNAGVRTDSLHVTADQIERHFQVNHLGHYLLTRLLLDALAAGAALSKTTSRVVHVASSAHAWGAVSAEVYGVQVRNTDPVLFGARMASNIEGVYGDTKLMQVLFSAELQRRLRHLPIQSIAVHPGFVATRFGATDRRWLQTLLVVTRPFLARDPQQGALTQVLAATSPNLPRRAGLYLDNCTIQTPALQARDATSAAWLWDVSAQLVRLPADLGLGSKGVAVPTADDGGERNDRGRT